MLMFLFIIAFGALHRTSELLARCLSATKWKLLADTVYMNSKEVNLLSLQDYQNFASSLNKIPAAKNHLPNTCLNGICFLSKEQIKKILEVIMNDLKIKKVPLNSWDLESIHQKMTGILLESKTKYITIHDKKNEFKKLNEYGINIQKFKWFTKYYFHKIELINILSEIKKKRNQFEDLKEIPCAWEVLETKIESATGKFTKVDPDLKNALQIALNYEVFMEQVSTSSLKLIAELLKRKLHKFLMRPNVKTCLDIDKMQNNEIHHYEEIH